MPDNGDGVQPTTLQSEPSAESTKNPTQQSGDERLGITLRDPAKSLLRKWQMHGDHFEDPNPKKRKAKWWSKMGWDVFERKALLIAAARDLQENGIENPMKLAATDIFVEKAQLFLDRRGKLMYICGAVTAALAVAVLAIAAWYVFSRDPKDLLQTHSSSDKVSTQFLAVLLVKSTTAGAFIVGIVTFLVNLSRALLHEATVLYSRRHSLRFGRLFVYLMSNEMKRADLEAVFNWNAEFSTAFKDIRTDSITQTPVTKGIEMPVDLVKSVGELVKALKPEKNDKAKGATA